jgi:hypothetical protein
MHDFSPDHAQAARQLAELIHAETTGLDNEDALANGDHLRSYARAAKYRAQDRAKVNGYRIALSFVLMHPYDMASTDEFIEGTGTPSEGKSDA